MAAWLCALVACLNAAAWSIITPPFQVPDEPEHVAYVNQIARTGSLPTKGIDIFSAEENAALVGLRLQGTAEQPEIPTISSRAQQAALLRDLRQAETSSETGSEGAGVATSQPPLYYALQAVPFSLAGGTLLDRIALMRLLSALMGGLTALFTYLFLRETLTRAPWAWTVGGLGVALVPLLGFMSGAVNPDAMLYAVTAAAFFGLARGFRRGLSRRHAIALGAVIAIGFSTKLNFIGLAPGILLGLIVLSIRASRSLGRAAYVSLAIALLIAFSPPLLAILVHVASGGAPLGIVTGSVGSLHGSLWHELSYVWELYLPRLPGMPSEFAGLSTPRFWFKGYVGLYGWLDTTFPGWVYELALLPAVLIVGLCVRALIAGAGVLRERIAEIVVYCVMVVGLMVLVGTTSYLAFPQANAEFAQFRYMLPLIPLLGLILALAAHGAGRRWGPVVGAGILMLFLGHDIFSQLQEVARFYG
jgi:4-amino-4-deoxy-L-arabinose transferase-like glycosyltransferase